MTLGIPLQWSLMIDKWTGHLFTGEILKMTYGFYYDVDNNDMPTVMFLIVFAIIFALVFFLIGRVQKIKPVKYSLGIVIFFSILFRIILLPGEMIHENDIYRYLWEGKTSLHKINPFKYAPADLFMYEHGYSKDYDDDYNGVTIKGKVFAQEDSGRLETLLDLRNRNTVFYDRIGHWQVPTIYPPVTQMLFMVPVWIKADSIWVMKAFFVLFDIGVLFLIIALLKHFKKNLLLSLIYGWSPLVLMQLSNSGHYDPIPIFFMMLSLLLWVKNKRGRGVFVLALATLSKFFAGVLLPIVVRPFKKRYLSIFIITIFLFYIPYFLWDQTGVQGVFQGLITYNKEWSYNASVFAVVYQLMKNFLTFLNPTFLWAKAVCGGGYLIFWVYLIWAQGKKENLLSDKEKELALFHRCFLAVAVLFIVNPVGDPWYFTWAMPFLCLFPYRSWILLSGLLVLSYLHFHSNIPFVDMRFWGIHALSWVIYVPFLVYWIFEQVNPPSAATLDFSHQSSDISKNKTLKSDS